MSAYANVARALGAEVRRLGRARDDLQRDARRRRGRSRWRATAAGRVRGRSSRPRTATASPARRAPRSSPSSSPRGPSIVVTGAHGKTTTAAMIAHALRETGDDPAWIIGGVVPQLGGNAGTGPGWLVVEGDESDRSVFALRPRVAVVTNVELDHFGTYGSNAELADEIDEWLDRGSRRRPRLGARAGVVRRWRSPGSTTAGTRPPRSRRSNGSASTERRRRRRSRRFEGVDRRFQRVGEGGGVTVFDDYAPQPDRDQGGARDRTRSRRRPGRRRLRPARRRADATSPPGARRRAGARGRRDRDGLRRAPRRPARGRLRADGAGRRPRSRPPRSGRRRSTTPPVWPSPSFAPATSSSRSESASRGAPRGRSPTGLPDSVGEA